MFSEGEMRTLIVDDSAVFRKALLELLIEETMCQVVGVAADGWEALQLARAERPDLILMDLNMPVWDGLKATRHIKAEMPQVRILLLTASSAEDVREVAMGYGAEDCLSKEIDQILMALERLAVWRGCGRSQSAGRVE